MKLSPTNPSEVEQLYLKHGSALVLFAASITGERARAQDAVHQVFLKMMQEGAPLHAADPRAYLFTCVRNAALNDAKVRQRIVPLQPESAWFTPLDHDYAAEQNLQRALCALPDDQRQVTVLHIWGELTFSQIAEVLDISANTAASRYRYALAKLREDMLLKKDAYGTP